MRSWLDVGGFGSQRLNVRDGRVYVGEESDLLPGEKLRHVRLAYENRLDGGE